jgi:hypothetical protein
MVNHVPDLQPTLTHQTTPQRFAFQPDQLLISKLSAATFPH